MVSMWSIGQYVIKYMCGVYVLCLCCVCLVPMYSYIFVHYFWCSTLNHFMVTTARVRMSGGIIVEGKLYNISKANRDWHQHFLSTTRLQDIFDSLHLQTSLKNYYYPSAISVEDYDFLEAFTNESISLKIQRSWWRSSSPR